MRVGFVGAGSMSLQHAKRLAKGDQAEVVAVCHPRPERAAKFVEAQPRSVQVYTDGEAMFDREKLDALYLCIPPYAHTGLAEQAAARGIHLFLEKPLALEWEAARRMTEAAEQAGVVTQVGFQFRFREGVQALKRLLESGEAGRPTLFSGRYWTNMDGNSWWRDRSRSGGQLIEQLIHLYDLAGHFLGEADLARTTGYVANLCHKGRPDYTIEDTSVGVQVMRNGGVSVITGSNNALAGHYIGDFRVVCERALLDYHSTGQGWVKADRSTLHVGGECRGEWEETGDATLALNDDFITAIREGRPAAIPIREGLRAQEWVQAVMDASGF